MLNKAQLDTITNSKLFRGISPSEIEAFLQTAELNIRRYKKNERVINEGDETDEVFVLLSGRVTGERNTSDGRAVTVNEMAAGDVFGDLISGVSEKSPVDVTAREISEMLSFKIESILRPDERLGAARSRLVRNLILVISDKYFALNRRVRILESNSLRERISLYLLAGYKKEEGAAFMLSHNREEQARYLACDRSALSRELSRMKAEGIIDYNNKEFTILDLNRLKRCAAGGQN